MKKLILLAAFLCSAVFAVNANDLPLGKAQKFDPKFGQTSFKAVDDYLGTVTLPGISSSYTLVLDVYKDGFHNFYDIGRVQPIDDPFYLVDGNITLSALGVWCTGVEIIFGSGSFYIADGFYEFD